ncbi:hypothetical protein N6H13_11980 [Paenibacillus sp. CC-CFT742]|nr:hypothetical protein [Paenibacillus sp. CC-CFT742]WJH31208.1 hypothetical protein N6H13_11980 [Paenibacillus sp. CC-CFT742]
MLRTENIYNEERTEKKNVPFILIEREEKPVRLRGNRVVPSTITVHSQAGLGLGKYVGFRSGIHVNLINCGGVIMAAPEAKHAYKLGNFVPATLSEEAVQSHASELFVREEDLPAVQEYTFSIIHSKGIKELYDEATQSIWIPGKFYVGQENVLLGWIRVSTKEIVAIGMTTLGEDFIGDFVFVPTMDPSNTFSIGGVREITS